MPELNLYRLHLRDGKCLARHPERTQTYEGQEKKKGWKKCECPIQASGTLGGKYLRKATGAAAWEDAKAWARTREDAGSWEVATIPPAIELHPVGGSGPKKAPAVADAIEQFLALYKGVGSKSTSRSYRWALASMSSFGERNGAFLVTDWTKALSHSFRQSLVKEEKSRATITKHMVVARTFWRFVIESNWGITDNPAEIRTQRSRNKDDRGSGAVEKTPFTDEEIDCMMRACEKYMAAPENYRARWRGEDVADYIQVNIHTGLRISDMATFHIDRLSADNLCKVRALKNGNWVKHKLPGWLADRMRWRAEKRGPYIFGQPISTDPNVYTNPWRTRLQAVWKIAQADGFEWGATPTPHRFRHTFARILLQTPGVTVRDVAELLGDSEEVVRKHYKSWCGELQERLNNVMDAAFKDSKPPAYLRPRRVS